MDLLYADKTMEEQDFGNFLDEGLFTPSPSESELTETSCNSFEFRLDNGMDWLDTLFDDPVLNDRMISDAFNSNNPHVQSEHSYSLANDKALDMTLKKELDKDSDSELLTTVNPNSMTPILMIKQEPISTLESTNVEAMQSTNIKMETFNDATSPVGLTSIVPITTVGNSHTVSCSNNINSVITTETVDICTDNKPPTMVTVTRTVNPQTLLKPTIILATQPSNTHHVVGSHISRQTERFVLPKVKVEQTSYSLTSNGSSSIDHLSYDQLSLPPTPPSSSTSDSEGCQSPDRSQPSSPSRGYRAMQSPPGRGYQSASVMHHSRRYSSPSPPPSAPFFMNPIPTSGVLILSEEEKRTLISEGYPIPTKLPLTKGEEKNLKKIRRKIKNKISAQESRRKKKEYLESLERKVESYSQENLDLKKKMDTLENSNRSLMSQLQKLQSIVNKIRPQGSPQTGTCLMVLVLCFAVFLGTWSPLSWRGIGYSSINATPGSAYNSMATVDSYYANMPPLGQVPIAGYSGKNQCEDDSPWVMANSAAAKCRDKLGGGESLKEKLAVIGPLVKEATTDPYATKMKSRVLLSIREEEELDAQSNIGSFCLKDYITKWFLSATHMIEQNPKQQSTESPYVNVPLPKVEILDVETEINQTRETTNGYKKLEQAMMHPDVAVMATVDTTA